MAPKVKLITDGRHNMVAYLEEDKKFPEYGGIIRFLKRSRILQPITTECVVYEEHIAQFWRNAEIVEREIVLELDGEEIKVLEKEIVSMVKDKEVRVSEEIIRKVIGFVDSKLDPQEIEERVVKGCFLRAGYIGDINQKFALKLDLSPPYKFLSHVLIHCLSHRKGGYEQLVDYGMCMMTALLLNLPYNFSGVIFKQMLEHVTANDKWWMYPRFLQLIINDQHPNLPNDGKEIVVKKMDSVTFSSMKAYRGMEKDDHPVCRKLIGHVVRADYVAPEPYKWRHDDSDSGEERERENTKMLKFKPTKGSKHAFVKLEEPDNLPPTKKRKRTPVVKEEIVTPQAVSSSDAVVTATSDTDEEDSSDSDAEAVEHSPSKLEFDRKKGKMVMKEEFRVRRVPVDDDPSYNPDKDDPKKGDPSKKTGRKKHVAIKKKSKKSKGPNPIDEPIDAESQKLAKKGADLIVYASFSQQIKDAIDLSKTDDTIKTPSVRGTPSASQKTPVRATGSQKKSQKPSTLKYKSPSSSSMFGSLPDFDKEFEEKYVKKEDFQELKDLVMSLVSENNRLRRENIEKQRMFEESESRRIAQARLLNEHIRQFAMLEDQLQIDFNNASPAVIQRVMDRLEGRSGTKFEIDFHDSLKKDEDDLAKAKDDVVFPDFDERFDDEILMTKPDGSKATPPESVKTKKFSKEEMKKWKIFDDIPDKVKLEALNPALKINNQLEDGVTDMSNSRPTEGASGATMESGDWRTHLQADSRKKIVNKIMHTLMRHLPFSGEEGQ